ncbi:hypothetical protein B0H13DRAFT_1999658 [Mycena leptocephala]|nr:hypothetical protein B0H13DRAFT_1999658 [Mycena leptocephala]
MQLETLAALLATILTVQAATLPQTPTHIYNVVYAPVLSGGTGKWSINNTWYYAITEDPAVAFGVDEGDDHHFVCPGTTKVATNSFPMIDPAKADHIPYAVFEIELWDQVWDFGPLTFTDITIVSNGTDGSWCSDRPYASQTSFQVSGVSSTVSNGRVACSIQSMVLQQPGGNATAAPTGGNTNAAPSTSRGSAPLIYFSCIMLSLTMLLLR